MSVANAIEAQKYVENKRFIKLSTIKKADRVRLIIVAGDDGLPQPLRRDHEFLAQLTRTEQHYLFHGLLFF